MTKNEALESLTYMLEFRNDSPNTIKMYQFYLGKFFDQLPNDFDISSLTLQDALHYIASLKSSGKYSESTLNLIISDIRTFFDLVLNKPLSRRRFPNIKYTTEDPYIFTQDQINLLYSSADVRLRAAICLGFDCGLRISEVISLRIRDIDSKNMLIHIHDSKRHKSRTVKLSEFCLKTLRNYWKVYRPEVFLFPGRDGNHLNVTVVHSSFRKLLKECNITDERARFHSLRATYATMMLQSGCDIFLLRKLLGHSSFSSTTRYIGMDKSDISASFSPTDHRSS